MDKVRVAIIGCGAFAFGQYLPNCKRSELIEITWLCSRTPEKRERAAREFAPDARLTGDAAEAFAADDVDLVILSVPHSEHERMVTEAAAAGKHILCEKPMAMTLDEAYRMQRAVQKAGVKLCVDYNRRYAPAMQDMKRVYWEHRRNPRPAAGTYWEAQRRILPEEERSVFMVRIQDESSTYRPVHIDWETGGGQVIGETCHWLDLTCWLFEECPIRLFATGSARMTHMITMEFASGNLASIIFAVGGTFQFPKELYELTDHAAFFRNLCMVETEYHGLEGVSGQKYPLQFDELPEVGAESGHSGYLAKLRERSRRFIASGGKEWPNIAPDKGHFQLLEAYAKAILEDQPAPVDERAGARATYLSRRAIDSIRLGHPVPVNEEDLNMFIW